MGIDPPKIKAQCFIFFLRIKHHTLTSHGVGQVTENMLSRAKKVVALLTNHLSADIINCILYITFFSPVPSKDASNSSEALFQPVPI